MQTIQSISKSPSSISCHNFSSETGGFAEHFKRSSSEIEEHLQNMYDENNNSVKSISNKTKMKKNVGPEMSNGFCSHYIINLETNGLPLLPKLKAGKFKQINVNHISKMITILSEKSDEETIPTNISSQIESTFLIIAELKEYLFVISKKTEEDNLLEEEVLEMNDNLLKMEKLLEKMKKCNILNKPKRTKKLELNLLDQSIEEPQFNSPKQMETQIVSIPFAPELEMTKHNNQGIYMFYFYPSSWGNIDYTDGQSLMKWMEVFGSS